MEGIGRNKRCRGVNASGDCLDGVNRDKTADVLPYEIIQDKQSPGQKRRRIILSQKQEDDIKSNMLSTTEKAISKTVNIPSCDSSSHEFKEDDTQANKMQSPVLYQHTKISDCSFQNQNELLKAHSKYIVKVPTNKVKDEDKKFSEYNAESLHTGQSAKRKRKQHISIPRCISSKAVNSNYYVYDANKLSPFNLLSDEIIVKIFEFVPRQTLVNGCALACKRLKNICYDEALWKRVDLGGKKIGPGQAGKIMLRGTRIMRMAKTTVLPPLFPNDPDDLAKEGVCNTSHHNNSSLIETSNIQLRLTHLDLSSAAIDEKCLESLFKKCWYLKKVALENCRLNECILNHLSQNNCLEVLHLAMAEGVTCGGLALLAQGLKNTLVELNLSWIGMDEKMIEETLLLLGNNSRTLTHLNLAGCKDSLTDERLNFILGN